MALMVLVHCCGTDPKTLLESSLNSWEGAQLEKVEGLQPKLQETPRIFFGLWSYLAGQTFLAIVLREDCLWAVRNLISEFKAVSGPETVVRQGALCRVHCLRNLVLNPNFNFFPSIFDELKSWGWKILLVWALRKLHCPRNQPPAFNSWWHCLNFNTNCQGKIV